MYKLVAMDIDGTILNDQSKLPEVNKIYARKLQEKGVKLVLCSGRSHKSLKYLETELNMQNNDDFGICFNGSTVYTTHPFKKLRELFLGNKLAGELLQEIAAYPQIEILVYISDTLYAVSLGKYIQGYFERCRVPIRLIRNFAEIKEEVTKIVCMADYEELKKLSDYARPKYRDKCEMCFTCDTLFEFNNSLATKGSGLAFLADSLKIDMKDVIAVGDNENDVTMLKEAGMGIAMKNGNAAAKEAANCVSETDNNDGILKEIYEKFFQ